MKIVFVKQKHVSFGGGEGYLDRLLEATATSGHEVHLVTTAWTDATDPRPFQVHTVPMQRHSRAARSRTFSREAGNAARALSPDLVFTLDRTEGADIWRAGEGVHRIWLERRAQFEPGWRTAMNARSAGQQALVSLEARCAEQAQVVIANSQLVARDLRQVYPALAARVEVIHNGIDLDMFNIRDRTENRERIRTQAGLQAGEAMLLFVGSGFRRKGLEETLQALLHLPGARLWVLGRDATGPWQRRVRQLGLHQRVTFLPPRTDLAPWYHAADLLAFPSWFESFGFVGLEAMACGTPVLTTPYAGVHELVQADTGGRVVDRPDDIEALAAAATHLLETRPDPAAVSASVAGATLTANLERTLDVMQDLARM